MTRHHGAGEPGPDHSDRCLAFRHPASGLNSDSPAARLADRRIGNTGHDQGKGAKYLMLPPPPPQQQLYVKTYETDRGERLNGSSTYRLRVPANVPTNQFWPVDVYDAATGAFIRESPVVGLDSYKAGFQKNPDGTADVYFGPQAPSGKGSNWIPTREGKPFFVMFRIYGPRKERSTEAGSSTISRRWIDEGGRAFRQLVAWLQYRPPSARFVDCEPTGEAMMKRMLPIIFATFCTTLALAQDYEFKGGFPTAGAAQKSIDDADLMRAVTAYRFFYPTVSMEATFQGTRDAGAPDNTGAMILAGGPRHTLFTGNSDTPYMGGVVNLAQTGPIVIELPAGPYLGIVNDHNFGWVADLGLPGPDAGKGGKHLVLPPDYKGDGPSGYFTSRSRTNFVLLAARALPPQGDMEAGLQAQRKIKIYPLAQAASPPAYQFVDRTKDKIDVTLLGWEDNIRFWEKLHKVLQEETAVEEFRPIYGMLANLGIEKGKPFAPDGRMRAILERAAKAGKAQMLVSGYASNRPDRFVWPDRKWEYATLRWENGDFALPTGIDLEARDRWYSQAVGMSPKMVLRVEGAGSLYWLGLRDKDGAYLNGSKTYRLSIPQPVPQKLFWSVTVYDAETRSQIQTDQDKAALRSLVELKDVPTTGATDLCFGPVAPAGQEGRWIKTNPGKGWFVYLRLYGPDGPAFNGGWKPGDFEEVN